MPKRSAAESHSVVLTEQEEDAKGRMRKAKN